MERMGRSNFFHPVFCCRPEFTDLYLGCGNRGQNNPFDSHPSPKAGTYSSFGTGRLNLGMDGDKQNASQVKRIFGWN